MTWLPRERLLDECTAPIAGLIRPHPHQSVGVLRDVARQWCTQPAWPLGRPDDMGLIVLAVDAVGYEAAEAVLSCDLLVCLTSTFPSTSVVSWLSSVTAAGPRQHGVAGPVAVRPGVDGVYNVIRGRGSSWEAATVDSVETDPPAPTRLPTLFDDLAADGVASVALIGDFLGICEGWIGDLTLGAHRHDPPRLLDDIRRKPTALATLAIDQVDAALDGTARRCVWAYVNTDEHIHFRGYDDELQQVLTTLGHAADDWADRGYTVILYSDHGQVTNECHPEDAEAFDRLAGPDWCRLPAGGAGRVRWLYPHPSREAAMVDQLADGLGDHAVVCHRDDVGRTGLTTSEDLPGAGEVIVIATDGRFPLPDPQYRYEHGSATVEEMLVPLAIWGPR